MSTDNTCLCLACLTRYRNIERMSTDNTCLCLACLTRYRNKERMSTDNTYLCLACLTRYRNKERMSKDNTPACLLADLNNKAFEMVGIILKKNSFPYVNYNTVSTLVAKLIQQEFNGTHTLCAMQMCRN